MAMLVIAITIIMESMKLSDFLNHRLLYSDYVLFVVLNTTFITLFSKITGTIGSKLFILLIIIFLLSLNKKSVKRFEKKTGIGLADIYLLTSYITLSQIFYNLYGLRYLAYFALFYIYFAIVKVVSYIVVFYEKDKPNEILGIKVPLFYVVGDGYLVLLAMIVIINLVEVII